MGEIGGSAHPCTASLPLLFEPYPQRASSSAGLEERDVFIRKTILEAAKLCVNSKDCSANKRVTQKSAINRHTPTFPSHRKPRETTVLHKKKEGIKRHFPSKRADGCFSPSKWTKGYLEEEGEMRSFAFPHGEILGRIQSW